MTARGRRDSVWGITMPDTIWGGTPDTNWGGVVDSTWGTHNGSDSGRL
ncbi:MULTISPECIES: hypothetical protein [Kitasatospora]